MIKCSLILHTRSSPRLLRFTLKALVRQRSRAFEVLVADDGDTSVSRDVVREFALMHRGMPIRHVTLPAANPREEAATASHAGTVPSVGTRAAVLQRAMTEARSDYVVVVSAGMLLQSSFVSTHLRYRDTGRMLVAGPGVGVEDALARRLLDGHASSRVDLRWLVAHAVRGELQHASRGVVVRAPWLRRWLAPNGGSLADGHFSLYKAGLQRLLDAGGADGTLDEWGLGSRLADAGLTAFDVSRLAVTFHLRDPSARWRTTLAPALPAQPTRSEAVAFDAGAVANEDFAQPAAGGDRARARVAAMTTD